MNDSTNPPIPEGPQPNGNTTGKILRDARLAAHIDLNKVGSDLRLSPQIIDALEKGDYHLLSGDPYIRALLGSLGRYLNLDTQSLIASYNREIGAAQPAPSIAPYKDRAHTYTAAHKQIFVIVFVALFVVLFLFIGKLNKGDVDPAKANPNPNAAPAESLDIPQDTGLESHSLAPDSIQSNLGSQNKIPADSGESRSRNLAAGARPDSSKPKITDIAPPATPVSTAKATPPPTPVVPAPAAKETPMPAPAATAPAGHPATPPATTSAAKPTRADTSVMNTVIIKPLIDSVGVKVVRKGKEDFATLLRLGKQMQVSHNDTIIVAISKRKAVEVTLDGKSVIPGKKRFKIYGTTLKAF